MSSASSTMLKEESYGTVMRLSVYVFIGECIPGALMPLPSNAAGILMPAGETACHRPSMPVG